MAAPCPGYPRRGGGRYPMVRIGILWPEIGILRRAGDGHALEVSLACRVGLALDAIRRRGRSRWGMSPLVGEAVGGSVPGVLCSPAASWGSRADTRDVNVFMRPVVFSPAGFSSGVFFNVCDAPSPTMVRWPQTLLIFCTRRGGDKVRPPPKEARPTTPIASSTIGRTASISTPIGSETREPK